MEPDEEVTITVSKAALADFWRAQDMLYDALGPAADDVYDIFEEECPRYGEVYAALIREADKNG